MSKSHHSHSADADENPAPQAVPPPDTGTLLAQLDAALAEAAKYKDQVLRSMADLDNFRRRAARDKEDTRRSAAAALHRGLDSRGGQFAPGLAIGHAGAPGGQGGD